MIKANPLPLMTNCIPGFNNYFKTLFTSQLQQQQNSGTSVSNIHETSTTDSFLDSIPDKEIWHILKHMKRDAAQGRDGFNVAFYRAVWPWIGDDVTTLVHNFYRIGTLPPEINKIFIVLIPKKNAPMFPHDFRPHQSLQCYLQSYC